MRFGVRCLRRCRRGGRIDVEVQRLGVGTLDISWAMWGLDAVFLCISGAESMSLYVGEIEHPDPCLWSRGEAVKLLDQSLQLPRVFPCDSAKITWISSVV